jgi:acetyl esterase
LARDKGGPKIAFQLLVYPTTDQNFERASFKKYGENHFLSIDMMRWFFGHYTTGETIGDWRVQPLHAESLRNLPPAHIIVAECDPLHDEGEAYGERLRAEGGTVTFVRYPGMIHGFFTFPAALDQGRQAIADAGAALRAALGAKASSAVGAGSAP